MGRKQPFRRFLAAVEPTTRVEVFARFWWDQSNVLCRFVSHVNSWTLECSLLLLHPLLLKRKTENKHLGRRFQICSWTSEAIWTTTQPQEKITSLEAAVWCVCVFNFLPGRKGIFFPGGHHHRHSSSSTPAFLLDRRTHFLRHE